MNRHIKSAAFAIISCALSIAQANAQQFTQEQLKKQKALYTQAQGDLARGKFNEAEKKARALIKVRPSDPYMRQLLVKIQKGRMDASSHSRWERQMRTMIVPNVNIDGATIDEVADYIRSKAKELAGDAASPNIVLRGDGLRDRTVTLRLKNVPLSEVLRYAGDLADVRFAYEKHAIVGYDRRPEGVAKKADPAPVAPDDATLEAKEDSADGFPAVLSFEAPDIGELLPRR